MEFGLLWYDNDPKRALEDKVGKAAQRYHEKVGRLPNTCYVHRELVAADVEQDLHLALQSRTDPVTIQVLSAPNVLQHHFWLGEQARTTKVTNN